MYRMGLLPADAMPDVWVFADQNQFAESGSRLPAPGSTVAGRTNRVTIESIVAHHGPRRGPSPTTWRRATVVVSTDGLLSKREVDYWNFFAQRLEDPNRTGVKSYDLYPSFDTLTGNRVDLQTDIVPRTAEPIIQPLSVDSPDFGQQDWPGVVFDGAVPSRYSTGTRTRLSGRVTDTSRNFDTLLVRLWKHDGGSSQALRYWTPVNTDGSFTVDIAPASPQTKDSAAWNQLCSSLDAIGDTELAFDAYAALPEPSDEGTTYILVYGILQALVLQQDAVRHVAEALSIPFDPDPLLTEIREVRNSSVGHPTKRRGETRTHFISRITMSKGGFQLLTVRPDHGPAEFRSVSIPALISTQRAQLLSVLDEVLKVLRARDEEHKAMFRDKKLTDAFPPTTGYYFEKLYESILGNASPQFGAMHLQLIAEAVDSFKSLLAERGSAGAYDGVEYHLQLVEYPLGELRSYFENPGESRLNAQDANIFIHFIQGQLSELQDMATEIDDSYQRHDDPA